MLGLSALILTALVLLVTYFWIWGRRGRSGGGIVKRMPPGPLRNKTPFVGYLPFMGSAPHIHLCELAKEYGEVFTLRFGSYDMVVLNDLNLIRNLFKEPVYSGRPNHLLAMSLTKHGITFATGPEAHEQRRFVLKSLRDLGFGKSSMETSIIEEVQELVAHFKSFPDGTTHELTYLFGLSVINALWDMLASRKFSLTDKMARRAYQVCIEGFIDPPVSGALWFLPVIAKAFPQASGYDSVVTACDELRNLVSEVVNSHKVEYERTHVTNDFVDIYLARIEEEKDVESSFYGERGLNNLIHVLIDLFTAGSDTLNSSINFAIKYLCENPEIQRQVHSELDKVLVDKGHSKFVTPEDRKNLPLLDAVITETLRISSIVTGGILHSTTEDTVLVTSSGQYNLPKDTIVMANWYWVHHNPANGWVNPDRFEPGRFLSGNNKKDDVLAFSTGRRVCIAEQMAQVEFFLFLGGLLANFTFEGVRKNSMGVRKGNAGEFGGIKPGLVLNVDGLVVRVRNRLIEE